jgi:hypothetical protein
MPLPAAICPHKVLICRAAFALLIPLIFIDGGRTGHAFDFNPSDHLSSPKTNTDQSVREIYAAVAGTKALKVDNFRATFEKNGTMWTITGAHAPIVTPAIRPKTWPVAGKTLDIQVISKPITNKKVLPWTEVIEGASTDQVVRLRGCPGEYEAASFVLRSGDLDFSNIAISASDLLLSGNTAQSENKATRIRKENIDIRVVKCWYQAGTELWIKDKEAKILTPELLLKDDSIVQVNHQYQVNLIKNFEAVHDSSEVKPFGIGKQENKQIWLTLHIPGTAASGKYAGKIRISADKAIAKELSVELDILPFKLDAPVVSYSMYYDAELLQNNEQYNISRQKRSEAQMLVELEDMRKHGISNPVITMKSWKPETLAKVLDLRKKAGIANEVIYYVTWAGLKDDPNYMKRVIEHCRNAVEFLKYRGVKEVFFYGFDELKGDKSKEAALIYRAFKTHGAKTFVAGQSDFFIALGPAIDIPIVWGQGGNLDRGKLKGLAEQAHKAGKKIWLYSFPQNGMEEPDTYRRNFGLTLWKLGIAGACNYAYQAMMHHPWDDFDHPVFRDEVITYPTVTGVIPTIQWEGWREGIKDVKYLTTLLRLRSGLKDQNLGARIDHELGNIDINGDLDQVRGRIISLISECLQTKR